MAKAPKPKAGGYEAAKERQERAKAVFRISVKESDVSFIYKPSLPIRVRGEVVTQTGKNPDVLLWEHNAIDVSTYVDMWWFSRLAADEAGSDGKPITRRAVQDEFDERCPGCTLKDIEDVDISDEPDDSPEA